MCGQSSVMCQLIAWLLSHIEILIVLVIGIGLSYLTWLDGYTKGFTQGQKQGFVNGIMHHIQLRAYNGSTDFPQQYQADQFVQEAQQKIANKLKPIIPASLTN